ncbi:myosin regulatory light chain, smooth muscle isoform X2 [Ruditapes philippinarum]|uniref:myosin regulatory light chain, smooth muscle isoform X2 n=1 Tax=Ruditapes philippinarum TaxID=129788 RepID=UPI00295B5F00|nr:myosin regulatory light chain, smooth muscle isoform X2 [Ruditapes philippinarum]
MSDDKEKKSGKKATSNVFTKLPQKLMQEMKEAFTMIDQNRDGLIDVSDLKEMYSNLGLSPQDKILQDMVKEAPGQLNFTMFLSLFSEKLSGTDPEETLRQAFQMFDADNTGYIPEEYMKDLLENMGDNFSKDEIRQTWKEAPISGGKVDYNAFVAKIKGKEQEEA